jgi:hypothetical protein
MRGKELRCASLGVDVLRLVVVGCAGGCPRRLACSRWAAVLAGGSMDVHGQSSLWAVLSRYEPSVRVFTAW